MYLKNELKKRLIISTITVFMLALTIVGSSYALFLDVKSDTEDQVLTAGDLQITYNGGAAINITEAVPVSDEEAFKSNDNEYIFTVLNKGDVPYLFDITIDDNKEFENLLEHKYIKYSLNLDEGNLLSNTDNGKLLTYQLNPGDTKLFNLKIWIPESGGYKLPNYIFDKEIHLKINIDGKAGVLEEVIEENNESDIEEKEEGEINEE